jgi:uncharacterized protein YndB with AHSA1/START domain
MSDGPVKAVVTHRFTASAERVYDAWLKPDWLGRFMFGPAVRDEQILHLKTDPRVGGKFSFFVRRGEMEIDHVGEYLEMDRPRRLVFTWGTADSLPETSRVIIDIVPGKTGCELTLTHEMAPKWKDFADRAKGSWVKMIAALEKALAE